jgi:hypothetical protein
VISTTLPASDIVPPLPMTITILGYFRGGL